MKKQLLKHLFLLLAFVTLFSFTKVSGQTLTLQLTPSNFNGYAISCFGGRDGSIDLTVTGGTPPYQYQWSNDEQTEDISGLPAQYYRVHVTDANGIEEDEQITLTEPEPLKMEVSIYEYPNHFNISLFGACNGIATLTLNGGVTPLTYLWSDASTNQNRTTLCARNYGVIATDANGCKVASEKIYLTEPAESHWTQTGNANTNPSTNFIGTTDNNDFLLKTNNLERFRIKSNGDLKIPSLSGTGSQLIQTDAAGNISRYPCSVWSTCGNSVLALDFIGSINNVDVPFKTNNLEVMRLKNYGKVSIKEFVNQTYGLLYTDNLGDINKIDFDYLNPSNYLDATGSWHSLPAGSSVWNVNGNDIYNSNSGNVGVGTSTPSEKFEVVRTAGTGISGGMSLKNLSTASKNSEIKFKQNSTNLWAIGCDVQHNNSQNFFIYDNVTNGGFGDTRFIIDANGNIGIGTLTQSEKLQVTDGSIFLQGENQGLIVDAQSSKRIGFMKYSGREAGIWRVANQDFEIGRVNVSALPGTPSSFTTDFYIDGSGRVGINTVPPTTSTFYKLFVDGGIAARDVKVTANTFPDYVFAKDYKLMSIYELEQYIKINQHMPEMPSAKEIASNNGYQIGEMIKKLVKQNEEQALYIIDLQKQVDELKTQFNKK